MKIVTIVIFGDLCSGKKTAADYFIKNNNYKLLETDYPYPFLKSVENFKDLTISDQSIKIDNKIFIENTKETLKEKIKKLKEYKIVIYPYISWEDYEDLRNKTSLRLVHIFASPKKRFSNYIIKNPNCKFEDFLENDALISSDPSYQKLKQKAFCHINNDGSLEEFEAKLSTLESVFIKHFRPLWDDYFMSVAHILADRSNCIKQKVGAVLVIDNRIISTGYNGTPKGLPNCFAGGCERCTDLSISQGSELDTCYCLHAEENSVRK
jgi:dCMP deaminase